MSTFIGVGKSKLSDAVEAGREAVVNSLKSLGDKNPDMVFVYSTFGYDFSELIKNIKAFCGGAPLVGASVFGVIDNIEGGDTDFHRVLVCAISSDDFKMTPVYSKGLTQGSKEIGKKIADEIVSKELSDIKGFYLLIDGLHAADPDSILSEIVNVLPQNTEIFGGSAAEPLLWKNTYQFFNTEVLEDSAVGVIFSGKVSFLTASSHGSQELGGYHEVTRAESARIYEIDNKPAMNLFSELYGEEQKEINGLTAAGVCLGAKISLPDSEDRLQLRIPLSSNPDGSILMAAAWPTGTRIYICQRDIGLISKRNKEVIEELLQKHEGKKPLLVFESDCMGRSPDQIGKDAAKEDINSALSAFNHEPAWFGGYMYGEIASVNGIAAFHNWTGGFTCLYVE